MHSLANGTVLLWLLLSGFASLIYQVVWLRELVTIYGSTLYASGAVLAAFMGGLAAGSAIASRYLATRPWVGFRAYGILEITIGLTGALSQLMLPLNGWLMTEVIGFIPMGIEAFAIKGLAALPFMLLPTMAMGATFPIFVRAWNPTLDGSGFRVASAYSLNTLGATIGTITTAFVLIPLLGLQNSVWLAVSVNLGVGLMALLIPIPTSAAPDTDTPAPARAASDASSVQRRVPGLVYFLTGFAAIGAEVLWVRMLVLYLGTSVYSFAIMLGLVLFGIGVGSLIVARFADRWGAMAWIGCLATLGLAMTLHLHAMMWMLPIYTWLEAWTSLSAYTNMRFVYAVSVLPALAIPTFLMGIVFPLGIRVSSASARGLARRAGNLYALNAAGGILGAIFVPTALMVAVGINYSMLVLGGLYFLSAFAVGWGMLSPGRRRRQGILATALLAIGAYWVLPTKSVLLDLSVQQDPHARTVAFLEGSIGTVTVTEKRGAWFRYLSLDTSGVNVAGTTPALITIQKLQGHLPLMLHPNPRAILHIGFGSGGTAHSVSLHPVERIDIAEISPDVVMMSRRYFEKNNHGVWRDPRVQFFWGDGRNYLLTADRTYDVILSDSVHPAHSGNGNLYTLEYFQLAAKRLNENGIFSMWLPTYSMTSRNFQQILKAFIEVFPDTKVWYTHNTLNRFTIVTGSTNADPMFPVEAIVRGFSRPEIARDLAEIHYAHPLDLIDNLLASGHSLRQALGDIEPHSDDRPTVEYESGRQGNGSQGWRINMAWLARYRVSLLDYLPDSHPWEAELVNRYELASRRTVDGHLAYLKCRPTVAAKFFDEALEVLPEHREPWEYAREEGVFEDLHPPWC